MRLMRRRRRAALVRAVGGGCGVSLGASTPGGTGTGRAELVPDLVPGNVTGCSNGGCSSDDSVRLLASATETWGTPSRRSHRTAPTGEWPSLLRMTVSSSDAADQARMKEFFTTALAPIAASSGCFLLLVLFVAAAKYRCAAGTRQERPS